MKRRDVYSFRDGLKMTAFTHLRITYVVNDNKRKTTNLIDDWEKEIAPVGEMKELIKLREDLAKKHSAKEKDGKPKMITKAGRTPMEVVREYDIKDKDDPKSKYSVEFAKLDKKYKKAIEEHAEKIRIYNEEFLDDECDFKPTTVKLTLVEEKETCPQAVMDLIYPMIKYN